MHKTQAVKNGPTQAMPASAAASAQSTAPDPCLTGQEDRLKNASRLVKEKKFDDAANLLSPCLSTASADVKKLHDKAAALAQKEHDRIADEMNKRFKAQKKREGVRIGMSEQDVLDSSWGKPTKVNRTTSKYGVHEQWVYGGGYLYFEDGVLTSIQN